MSYHILTTRIKSLQEAVFIGREGWELKKEEFLKGNESLLGWKKKM